MRRTAPADGFVLVGVTGGAAAGKSTLVRRLAEGGPSRVVDADRLGHEVLADPAIARAIAAHFGADVLDAGGLVRREVLGPRVFASPDARRALDAIVHPPLLAKLRATVDGFAREGFRGMVIVDAALLAEWDLGPAFDRVVCVVADPAVRVKRLAARSGMSEENARRVLDNQMPDAERAAYSDDVLANDGTLEAFDAAARAFAGRAWDDARRALAARAQTP